MKRFLRLVVLGILFVLFPLKVNAEGREVNIHLFYGSTCPHCAAEEKFLAEYLNGKDNVHLYMYEVWGSTYNQKLMNQVAKEMGVSANGVPFTVIGKKVITGFSESYTPDEIKNAVEHYLDEENTYRDYAGEITGKVEKQKEEPKQEKKETKKETKKDTKKYEKTVPVLGKINAKTVSLPILSIVLGFVDGFNPCAMWILIFLISMLIGLKDKRKLMLYGSVFLISSGAFYFLLMFTFLKAIANISVSLVFRWIIAGFALIAGAFSLYNYIKSLKEDDGCTVTNSKQKKVIMTKIKEFVNEKNVLLALVGIVALAIGVNFIELLCSAGLPTLFTEILALNKVSTGMGMIYNLIYIIFFMIDDFIIFMIAVKTMNLKVISTKYSKYSHLIGGIIMLIIGILLIFKPAWVMFNF